MGNYNDALLEQLADQGDGFYAYVNDLDEARRLFIEDLTGTLQTVALDAKVQVEFDPRRRRRVRLARLREPRHRRPRLHAIRRVDAGAIGAGHAVTALYVVRLRDDAGRARRSARSGCAGPTRTPASRRARRGRSATSDLARPLRRDRSDLPARRHRRGRRRGAARQPVRRAGPICATSLEVALDEARSPARDRPGRTTSWTSSSDRAARRLAATAARRADGSRPRRSPALASGRLAGRRVGRRGASDASSPTPRARPPRPSAGSVAPALEDAAHPRRRLRRTRPRTPASRSGRSRPRG